jgi:hypothetical protein
MGKRAAAVAGFASIALTFTVVDAAIEHFLLFLVASVFAIDQWMRMTPGAEQLPRQLSLAAVRRRLRGPAIEAAP